MPSCLGARLRLPSTFEGRLRTFEVGTPRCPQGTCEVAWCRAACGVWCAPCQVVHTRPTLIIASITGCSLGMLVAWITGTLPQYFRIALCAHGLRWGP